MNHPADRPLAPQESGDEGALSRRRFVAAAAAAVGAAGAVASGAAPAGAVGSTKAKVEHPAGHTGGITDAKHVVIMMQENRSFDHYFGTLNGVRGFGDRVTVELAGGHSVFDQPSGSQRQYPWAFSTTEPAGGADPERLAQCSGDLAHGWSDQHAAWNKGRMDAWVAAKSSVRALGYLRRGDIPFHYALADNWTICDAYHCSALSATGPNRTYLWSGQIDPEGTAGGPAYNGGDESGLRWRTYAEALQNAGVTWKVYQNADDNYGDNGLAYFTQFNSAPASSPLRSQGMGSVPPATGNTNDDIIAALRADVISGSLPQVTWIVPNQDASEHPYATPADGAHFVHNVMDALNADPDVFNSTVMFLNYDENDGFFDHVPPPVAPAGTPGEFYDGTNIGLGFRVPMTVISPWSRGGWTSSEVFDHTSVLRFLEVWTAALGKPAVCEHISDWRREVCGDLTGTLDFANPVFGMPALPDTSAQIGLAACGPVPNPVPVDNSLPQQEPGTRPARALPYALSLRTRIRAGALELRLRNQGRRAAALALYSGPGTVPTPYTVGAGDRVEDSWTIGPDGYDLRLHGPNGSLWQLRGRSDEAVDAYLVESAEHRRATIHLSNHTRRARTVLIGDTVYRSHDEDGWRRVKLLPGSSRSVNLKIDEHGWYDLAVGDVEDPWYLRRFTGRLADRRPGTTDPAARQAAGLSAALTVPPASGTIDESLLLPGKPSAVTVTVTNPGGDRLTDVLATLVAPSGWTVTALDSPKAATLGAGASLTIRYTVTPPADGTSCGAASPTLATAVHAMQAGRLQLASAYAPVRLAPQMSGYLLAEDFESVAPLLQPKTDLNVPAGVLGWTRTAPSGWHVVNADGMPQGTAEEQGWSFMTKRFWFASDGQDRQNFTRGLGVIAVADADDWDDTGSPSRTGTFDSTLVSPSVSFPAGTDTLHLGFDSHYRQESPQQAQVTAVFDSGRTVTVLDYGSAATGTDNAGKDAENAFVSRAIPVPAGASSVTLQFRLFDAGNNWYWAIDHIRLDTKPISEC